MNGAASMSGTTRPNGPPHPITDQQPRPVTIDGAACVLIPLSGKHGIGKEAIVGAADWAWIGLQYGEKWVAALNNRDSNLRIVSGRAGIASAARQSGPAPLVLLARIVAGAEPGERVFIKNGNTLDLRFDNLEAVSNDTIAAFMANLHEPAKSLLVEVG